MTVLHERMVLGSFRRVTTIMAAVIGLTAVGSGCKGNDAAGPREDPTAAKEQQLVAERAAIEQQAKRSGVAVFDAADPSLLSDFDRLDHEGQKEQMKTKVMPATRITFREFDPTEYAKFNCKTCHGKDAEARDFEMPNPSLPKLNWAKLEATTDADEQRAIDFMIKLTHQMSVLLGDPERSVDNADGFGCLSCHVEEK